LQLCHLLLDHANGIRVQLLGLHDGLKVEQSLELRLHLRIVWIARKLGLKACDQPMDICLQLVEIILWVKYG
jgi:hypothetical protein